MVKLAFIYYIVEYKLYESKVEKSKSKEKKSNGLD